METKKKITSQGNVMPKPNRDENGKEKPVSASNRKISSTNLDVSKDEYVHDSVKGHTIINLDLLQELIFSSCVCKVCLEGKLVLSELQPRKGLAVSYSLQCDSCDAKTVFCNSKQLSNKAYEVNVRCVYALRSIGKGLAGGNMLCSLLDIPSPPQKFMRLTKMLAPAIKTVAEESMKTAAKEAVEQNDSDRPTEISAAIDGTWQKRGYTSLNGVITLTSFDTGKVLDYECLTRFCHVCKGENKGPHECKINYVGSSGGMESSGAINIFRRSVETRGVKYTKYLGDGDSKAFSSVIEDKPYEDCDIEKLECVGHIQKRMGSRLRRLCKAMKGKKLSDGKIIRGKGRLTDATIDKLQNYYGLAIRRNSNNLQNMIRDVWSIYFHKLSTNENPQHGLCPKGEESWCQYNRAIATNTTYTHNHSLPEPVLLAIKPIFKDLSNPDLLRKCLHGQTQNPNESFNSVIWKRVPKTEFVGINTLELGVADAVLTFNDGNIAKSTVLKSLGCTLSKNTIQGLQTLDRTRIYKVEKAAEDITKEARMKKRQLKRKTEDAEKQEEEKNGPDYGPGLF